MSEKVIHQDCAHELAGAGLPSPRTCRECGLGPCKHQTDWVFVRNYRGTGGHIMDRPSNRHIAIVNEKDAGLEFSECEKNGNILSASLDFLVACNPILEEAAERTDYMHHTYNPDAHIELTLTIAEGAAVDKAKGGAL